MVCASSAPAPPGPSGDHRPATGSVGDPRQCISRQADGRATRGWLGSLGAGSALGLAIMSKGPHIAFLQTVVPAVLFGCWIRFWPRRSTRADGAAQSGRFTLPLIVGTVIALVIGLWWYACVLQTTTGVWNTWFHEVTRIQANAMKPDPWYQYAVSVPRFLLPWTAWVLLGRGICNLRAPDRDGTSTGADPQDLLPSTSGIRTATSPESGSSPNIVFALLLLLVAVARDELLPPAQGALPDADGRPGGRAGGLRHCTLLSRRPARRRCCRGLWMASRGSPLRRWPSAFRCWEPPARRSFLRSMEAPGSRRRRQDRRGRHRRCPADPRFFCLAALAIRRDHRNRPGRMAW